MRLRADFFYVKHFSQQYFYKIMFIKNLIIRCLWKKRVVRRYFWYIGNRENCPLSAVSGALTFVPEGLDAAKERYGLLRWIFFEIFVHKAKSRHANERGGFSFLGVNLKNQGNTQRQEPPQPLFRHIFNFFKKFLHLKNIFFSTKSTFKQKIKHWLSNFYKK